MRMPEALERGPGRALASVAGPVALVLALIALAAPGRAAAADPVTILSPRAGALETGSTVAVEIATRGPVRRVSVSTVRGRLRPVSAPVRRAGEGRWRVTLRLGRDLVRSRNHLFVTAHRAKGRETTASRHFTVARPRAGLLSVGGLSARPVGAPVDVTIRTDGVHRVRATLNGRGLGASIERDGPTTWRATLAAHDGLRFGDNRLVVTAFDASRGIYQRVARTVSIARDRPLPGAGYDRVGRVGAPVTLDGHASRAAGVPGALSLRWRIASAPPRSTARLARPTSPRPRLVADRPGRYALELRASEPGGQPSAIDTVEVAAQPNAPPSGVAISTIGSAASPGIRVGSDFYPMTSGGWVQMLVLDRQTLAPSGPPAQASTTYDGSQDSVAQLVSDVQGLSSDDLAVLSGNPTGTTSSAGVLLTDLAAALTSLGYDDPGIGSMPADGRWSVVGTPGTPAGNAYQFVGLSMSPGAVVGAMQGFLQVDSSGNYTFTWPPEYIPFDTHAPGTSGATQVVSVDGASTSTAPGGAPGFSLFWYDADSLTLRDSVFFPAAGMTTLGESLIGIAEQPTPALVVVTSSNAPAPAVFPPSLDTGGWGFASTALGAFGANPYVVLGLDGSGDYTLVGLAGVDSAGPNQGTELSQVVTKAVTPRITGALTRNRQGLYESPINGSPDPTVPPSVYEPDLQIVLAQPAVPFPAFSSRGAAAAERYIAGELGLALDPTFGIRGNYWQNDSIKWTSKQDDLTAMSRCTSRPCARSFASVRRQLLSEFGAVSEVRGYFTGGAAADLDGVLNGAFTSTSFGFEAIASDVLSDLAPQNGSSHPDNALSILEGSMSIGSGLVGEVPIVGSFASGPFKVAAGISTIIGATTNTSDGSAALLPYAIEGEVYSIGTNLQKAFSAGVLNLSHVADLLVSDWGRLQAAEAHIQAPGTASWGLNTQTESTLAAQMERGLAAYIWQTLLPVPMKVWQCRGADSPCATLFQPPSTSIFPFRLPDTDEGQAVIWNAVLALGRIADAQITPPSATTMSALFGKDGLGVQPPYFLAPAQLDGNGNATTPGFATCNSFDTNQTC